MVKRFFFRLFCVYCFFFFISGAGFPFKGLFVGFFGLGSYVGFVRVCFWVSNERVVRDFSERSAGFQFLIFDFFFVCQGFENGYGFFVRSRAGVFFF